MATKYRSFTINRVKFMTVRISKLFIDPTYQRTESLDTARCRRIKDAFSWNAFAPLKVAYRPKLGMYAIIDGQHRFHVLLLLFNKTDILVPVAVVDCRNAQEEAACFIDSSTNSKSLSPNAIFKAKVAAGEKAAVEIVRVLKSNGITISYTRGRMNVNETKSPSAFEDAYTRTGPALFRQLVELITLFKRADDDDAIETEALKPIFVKGLATFITRYDFNVNEIRAKIDSGYSAAEIMKWVREQEDGRTGSHKRNELVVAALCILSKKATKGTRLLKIA